MPLQTDMLATKSNILATMQADRTHPATRNVGHWPTRQLGVCRIYAHEMYALNICAKYKRINVCAEYTRIKCMRRIHAHKMYALNISP